MERRWKIAAGLVVWAGVGGGWVMGVEVREAEPYLGVTEYQYVQQPGDAGVGGPFDRDEVAEVLEINVKTAGVQFLVSPGNGALPGEVTQMTTAGFVNSVGAQMGINGSFFDTAPPYTPAGVYTDLSYVAASQGSVYSPAGGGESLFNITAGNVASIEKAGAAGATTASNGSALYNAIGGNLRILTNGALVNTTGAYATTLNPHTAIGVSKDGSEVFLMTVDGRQTGFSEGMYTYEMAQILANLGAWNAINLDGGGSTTMVMDDSNDGKQDARVIDSPSDDATTTGPGVQRVVGNNVAVFATMNPGYVPLPNLAYPGEKGVVPYLMTGAVLDRFEGSAGNFATGALASGSNHNVSASSSVTVDNTRGVEGTSSLKVSIVNTNGGTQGMQLRLLSAGGTPTGNLVGGEAMSSTGYFGFWLMMPVGSSPLYVSTLLDDGTTTSSGTEYASFQRVVADGAWHMYQWALFDADSWTSFSGGDGAIGGPDVFLDSIYFSSTNGITGGTDFSGTVWVDGVSYNPGGSIVGLVPEPGGVGVGVVGMWLMGRRRDKIKK